MDNKKRATCFATLPQTKLNGHVVYFTNHVPRCVARDKVAKFVFADGNTSNIPIQLIL